MTLNRGLRTPLVVAIVATAFTAWRLPLPRVGTQRPVSTKIEPPRADEGAGSARLIYRPNVRIVEKRDALLALKGISSNGNAFAFRNNAPFSQLKSGDVLVVKGLLARRIVMSQVDGDEIVLLTRPALITETINQGTIHVDAPIRFGRRRTAWSRPPAGTPWSLIPPLYAHALEAQESGHAEPEDSGGDDEFGNIVKSVGKALINGWTTDFAADPSPNKIDLHLKMTRDIGGFRAVITGEGYLADFQFSTDIDIEPGPTTSFIDKLSASSKRINGLMNFKWEVAKDSPGPQIAENRIKLPVVAEIPLYQYLEGIPLFLEISGAVVINPMIAGGKEYSRGAFRVTYNGAEHFDIAKGNVDADGNVTGDIQFLESQNISMVQPFGMVVAFIAPRIELSFGTTKIFSSEADDLLKEFKEGHEKIQKAANRVDQAAAAIEKNLLDAEDYEKLKELKLGEMLENATQSDATGYLEVISSSGMSFNSMSGIFPCTRTDIHLRVRVGANAQLVAMTLGEASHELYHKQFTRIDPPGTKACEDVGK